MPWPPHLQVQGKRMRSIFISRPPLPSHLSYYQLHVCCLPCKIGCYGVSGIICNQRLLHLSSLLGYSPPQVYGGANSSCDTLHHWYRSISLHGGGAGFPCSWFCSSIIR